MLKKIGLMQTLLFLMAFIFVLVISELTVIFIIRVTHNKRLTEASNDIIKEEILSSFRELDIGVIGIKGIYPEVEIAQMERRNTFDTIWLVSHDMKSEVEDGEYSGVVLDNLKKGTKYCYFVPHPHNNREIITRIKMIMDKCGNNDNLKFYFLNEDFFFLVPEIDFAIYEPFNNAKRKGYMGIDIQGLEGRYATLMSSEFIDTLLAQLFMITQQSKEVRLYGNKANDQSGH